MRKSPIVVALLAVAVLSACARLKPEQPKAPAQPVAVTQPAPPPAYEAPANLGAKDRMLRIIRLMEEGNTEHARVDLRAYLVQNQSSKLGASLLEQIDLDPKALLGAVSFPYEIRANESLSQLAERFLGDRYKFWALARYNGISNPTKIVAGQRINIPGVLKAEAENSKPLAADEEEVARRLAEEQAPPKPPEPVKPIATTSDPLRAMALRKLGLENLQRGKIDQAIAMLRQALDLAPTLAVIQSDLARALKLRERVK